jgi:hypothetical protein
MARRQIGQEVFAFVADPTPPRSSLDRSSGLIDRSLADVYAAAKGRCSLVTAGPVQSPASGRLVRLIGCEAGQGAGGSRLVPALLRVRRP